MSQNLVSLNFSADDLAAIDDALTTLEQHFAKLMSLDANTKRGLTKMGDKSESFCRQTLTVLAGNTQLLPPSFNLAETQSDLAALEALRPRMTRLHQLLEKGDDTLLALGSDLMSASLEGYALLKVSGKGAGVEQLRQVLSARFNRSHKNSGVPAPAPAAAG